ncbi:MAG: hypothetical protein JSS02_20865 [Planctomycetes bacterium]|nr:hypothetical protein [Planctomycetota bacterium]
MSWQTGPYRKTLPALVLASLTVLAQATEPENPRPELRIVRDQAGHPTAVESVGWRDADLRKLAKHPESRVLLPRLLAVYVATEGAVADVPAVAGEWTVAAASVRFTPRFPLLAGVKYRAELRPDVLAGIAAPAGQAVPRPTKPITLEIFSSAEEPATAAEVVQVYPSSAVIPENNLRFYIHFSESMGRGEAYSHLHLLNAKGQEVTDAFLEIGEELWDPRAKRLTLLIDPGRIKKGVQPREELGPVLEAGQEYTLVIDRRWRDASGRPLKADFRKTFRTAAPAEAAIDPAHWKLMPPSAGTVDPLVIRFPAPLDRALLERTITVTNLQGEAIVGRVSLADDERRWEFRPQANWGRGRFLLVIDTALEDLAGNRIGKPFEVDQFTEVDKTSETEPTRVSFEIR